MPFVVFLSLVFGVLFTKIVRNNTVMTTKTPLLVAMALTATQNNNQQTKGANKRGDGVEAMETATAMIMVTAMATGMASGNSKGNCDGDGNGDGDSNSNINGEGNGNDNTTINKQRSSGGGGETLNIT